MSAVLKAVQPAQTLESLADAWATIKHAEDAAAKQRMEIEAAIIAQVGERDEGSETRELTDGRKLTVTAKITRKVDADAWRRVMHQVPEQLRPIAFVEDVKLDLKGIRYLQEHRPDVYSIVATALTVTKAKTSISVKL